MAKLKKEIKVFVVKIDDIEDINVNEISDEKFMEIAEDNGYVYTLKGFEKAFNRENVYTNIDFIRFIEVYEIK